MKEEIVVKAFWDEDAEVWVASSDDIRGLSIEAPTVEALRSRVLPAIQDLIELNGLRRVMPAVIPVSILTEQHDRVLNPCQ